MVQLIISLTFFLFYIYLLVVQLLFFFYYCISTTKREKNKYIKVQELKYKWFDVIITFKQFMRHISLNNIFVNFVYFLRLTKGFETNYNYKVKSGRCLYICRVDHSKISFFSFYFWIIIMIWITLSSVNMDIYMHIYTQLTLFMWSSCDENICQWRKYMPT